MPIFACPYCGAEAKQRILCAECGDEICEFCSVLHDDDWYCTDCIDTIEELGQEDDDEDDDDG